MKQTQEQIEAVIRGWGFGPGPTFKEHDMATCSLRELVEHIDTFGKRLSEWEIKFIAGLIDNPPEQYSKKQIKIIDRIYDEKC